MIEPYSRDQKIKKWLKTAAVLFLLLFAFLNLTSYFNPLHFCYINLDADVVRGNRSTIKSAIKLLRKQYPTEYKQMCKYVNRISERYCHASDWNLDASLTGSRGAGCFIQGSKTIFLTPDKRSTDAVVENRMRAIALYGSYSREFWSR